MGLLDARYLQQTLYEAFAPIFETGQLIRQVMERQPDGTVLPVAADPKIVSVQVGRCDEAMRRAEGYTAQDAKIVVLRDGHGDCEIDSDDLIIIRHDRWKVKSVTTDPARSHWVVHAAKERSND